MYYSTLCIDLVSGKRYKGKRLIGLPKFTPARAAPVLKFHTSRYPDETSVCVVLRDMLVQPRCLGSIETKAQSFYRGATGAGRQR
jgi:hypothetical protein